MTRMTKPKKIASKVVAGAVTGAILLGSALPAMAGETAFRLPVSETSFSIRNNILSAVYDIDLAKRILSDYSLPSAVLMDVAKLLSDDDACKLMKSLKELVTRYKISMNQNDLKNILDYNQKVIQHLEEKFPAGYTALKNAYVAALRNHGVMGMRPMSGVNVQVNANPGEGSGGGGGIQPNKVAPPPDFRVGANTTAIANVFFTVNVSVWSNAIAVVLFVTVGAFVIP
jgi:hypothetical protein